MIDHSDIQHTVKLKFNGGKEYREFIYSYKTAKTIFCESHSDFFERGQYIKQSLLARLFKNELVDLYSIQKHLLPKPEMSDLLEYTNKVISNLCNIDNYYFDVIYKPIKNAMDAYIIVLEYSVSHSIEWDEQKSHDKNVEFHKNNLIRTIFYGYMNVKESYENYLIGKSLQVAPVDLGE